MFGFEFLHHRPEEANELACGGNRGDLIRLPGRDAVVEFVEPMLSLPGMCDDMGWLASLSFFEIDADGGSMSVLPGRLDEHVAAPTVAGLSDRPLALAIS